MGGKKKLWREEGEVWREVVDVHRCVQCTMGQDRALAAVYLSGTVP